ncbi:hypothetical protein GA0115242_136211 [Streptomyces sp. SolWspMP-5a-2]|jgi:hypothetical protein|nr:hypothetical protein GA0115242_136211 [Streptomyces sp. SolWspMP-5a-2]
MPGGPQCGWGPPGGWPRRQVAGPRTRSFRADPGDRGHGPRSTPGGVYSRSSAYEPMARAMSAWAQKRWYVNTGAAPPLR